MTSSALSWRQNIYYYLRVPTSQHNIFSYSYSLYTDVAKFINSFYDGDHTKNFDLEESFITNLESLIEFARYYVTLYSAIYTERCE